MVVVDLKQKRKKKTIEVEKVNSVRPSALKKPQMDLTGAAGTGGEHMVRSAVGREWEEGERADDGGWWVGGATRGAVRETKPSTLA